MSPFSAASARVGIVLACLGLIAPVALAQDASESVDATVEIADPEPVVADTTVDTTVDAAPDTIDTSLDVAAPAAEETAETQPWLPGDGKPYWSNSVEAASTTDSRWQPSDGQPPWAKPQGQPEWAGRPSQETPMGSSGVGTFAANEGNRGKGRNK
jgi:hypothetical protein